MTRKQEERPKIKTLSKIRNPLPTEEFQNNTLRPILKMKNDLLIAFFKTYTQEKKIKWSEKNNQKKEDFIYNNLSKDINFKNAIVSMILGNFSLKEYNEYSIQPKEYNKRIWKMLQQRICSQLF
jgi:hypothetical protein